MYISIDCDNMVFLRKHHDLPCVCNLAWIESQELATYISDITDATVFHAFTLMELQMLYRKTTGIEINGDINKDVLSQILFGIANRLPIADVKPFELEIQAKTVLEDPVGLIYCKNATRPTLLKGKPFPILKANKNLTEELSAIDGNLPDVLVAKKRIKTSSMVRKPRLNKTSLIRGTAKEVIWETANSMWKESGSPKDKKIVLSLRKLIMDNLEENGIKRASASSELGKWHKETIPE